MLVPLALHYPFLGSLIAVISRTTYRTRVLVQYSTGTGIQLFNEEHTVPPSAEPVPAAEPVPWYWSWPYLGDGDIRIDAEEGGAERQEPWSGGSDGLDGFFCFFCFFCFMFHPAVFGPGGACFLFCH
jgi:hypothetical protein